MQYLDSVIADGTELATPGELAAIDAFNDRLRAQGYWDFAYGPEAGLAAVDRLEGKLSDHHAYHATRADLLRRLGFRQESRAAYDKAIELAANTAELAYLTRRRDQLV